MIMCAGCVSDTDALLLAAGGLIAAGRTSVRRLRRRSRVQIAVVDAEIKRGADSPIGAESERQ